MTATPTPRRHKAPENTMTVDLSTCPPDMRTRDGRRAVFAEDEKSDSMFPYRISGEVWRYRPDGSFVGTTQTPHDLIGPWWEVGRTYLHDGSAECPLPERARADLWFEDGVLSPNYIPTCWSSVRAYILTHLPEPKKSLAERLREIADRLQRYGMKKTENDILAIADELEAET